VIEAQRLAALIVGQVLAGRSLDRELAAQRARSEILSASDRGLLQDLAYGTLRFLGEVDGAIDALLDRPLTDDRVRNLLRVATYQLVHTRAAPYAIVDHAVQATAVVGVPAARGLVNAVLRNFLRRRDDILARARSTDAGRYSYPVWWIDKVRSQYPEDYREILAAGNEHPPLTLRVNTRRTSVEQYVARLGVDGMTAIASGETAVILAQPVPVERVPGFGDGDVSVQDAAAQLAAAFLNAASGERVLDACAAPGGKTAHILERSDVDLLAIDVDAARLERVRSNLTRLHLSADLAVGDAVDPAPWWDGRAFNAILADVPCSASGVVRRHPDIKWLRRADDIARFAEKQSAILDALWQTLASNGKLLYVTCSIFHEENHNQIARFLERHQDAHRQTLPWPPHVQQLAGQILPDEQHDGFFYALLEKR